MALPLPSLSLSCAAMGTKSCGMADENPTKKWLNTNHHSELPTAAANNENTIKKKSYRSEEHTSELQSRPHLVCRLLLEKKNQHRHVAWIREQQILQANSRHHL